MKCRKDIIFYGTACSEIPIAQKIKVFGMPSRNYIQFNFTKIDEISLTNFKNNLWYFFSHKYFHVLYMLDYIHGLLIVTNNKKIYWMNKLKITLISFNIIKIISNYEIFL